MKQALLNRLLSFSPLGIISIMLAGCSICQNPVTHKWSVGKTYFGNGIEGRRVVPSEDFTGIRSETMDVELYQDTVNAVIMYGDSNIISLYHTTVSNGILTVDPCECSVMHMTHEPRLEIHMKQINYIRIEGHNLVGKTPIVTNKLRLVELSTNASLDVTADTLICDLTKHSCNTPNLFLNGTANYTWVGLREGARISALTFKGHCMDIMHEDNVIYLVNPKSYDVMHFGPIPSDETSD